ncbi:MAG TPA: hypothetical protein PK530_16315, partial [Anaerolineales bacterium]|nr:hypothetical protein [Anaerolineales bacterium]
MSEQTPDIKFFYDDQPAFPRDKGIIRILIIVAVIFYSLYLIMLRDIVFHLPELMRAEMVMNGDELVPFFNVHSQFIDQVKGEFNDLTNGYEFRVRYSILTTWMRYYKVLPFALLFVVPTVAYGSYLAVSYFLQRVLPSVDKQAIFRTAAAPVLLIYLILTYTKITHFYTLILGFGGFLIATLFSAYGLLFSRRHPYRYMAIGCFIAVLNPAIHYIILYSMFISLLVLGAVIMEGREYLAGGGFFKKLAPKTLWRLFQENRKTILDTFVARVVGMFGCLGTITLIPYAIFVKFFVMTGISNLSETIPVTYYFIKDASISFAHLVSFDLAGIMDKVLGGDYLSPHPRVTNVVYTFILLMPLIIPPVKR